MNNGQNDEKWHKFVEALFKTANMPEVTVDQLEAGTYTNAQIAEKLRESPLELMSLVASVSELGGGDASRRQVLSFAVDMVDKEK